MLRLYHSAGRRVLLPTASRLPTSYDRGCRSTIPLTKLCPRQALSVERLPSDRSLVTITITVRFWPVLVFESRPGGVLICASFVRSDIFLSCCPLPPFSANGEQTTRVAHYRNFVSLSWFTRWSTGPHVHSKDWLWP